MAYIALYELTQVPDAGNCQLLQRFFTCVPPGRQASEVAALIDLSLNPLTL